MFALVIFSFKNGREQKMRAGKGGGKDKRDQSHKAMGTNTVIFLFVALV